jgi:hypothetical protein
VFGVCTFISVRSSGAQMWGWTFIASGCGSLSDPARARTREERNG